MPDLDALINAEVNDLRAIRHDLHAHPELGYTEHRTAAVVVRELQRLGIQHKAGMAGGTGVVAHLPASSATDNTKPAVGLRADMDALPISEETGLPYASTTPGLMHACGHDGHTTILLGAARVLSKMHRPNPVTFVFQPAEEGGGGGDKLCKEGALDGLFGPKVGRMFGLHCWPEFELGTIGSRPGPLLASTDEIRVTLRGVGSHAAFPHYSRDPIVAAAHCITALQTVASRNVAPLDSVVVTIGKIEGGTANNVIPVETSFIGTIRTLKAETRALARDRVRAICEHTAIALGCEARVELNEGYPVTHNDPTLTDHWFAVAERVMGKPAVIRVAEPVMGGEDFAYYGRKAPAVFFCLGIRPKGRATYPTVHKPDFDFNDDALPIGVRMFCELATS
ncbi:MAG: M20 metallopeptidase family protein [Phycisphaerales bacterium]